MISRRPARCFVPSEWQPRDMADEASERLSRGQQNGHLAPDSQEHRARTAVVLPSCHYPGRNLQMHLAINDTEPAPWSNPLAGLVVSSDVSSSADWRAVLDAKSTDSALVIGDARAALAAVPDETFQTTITSPPYWSLRDYGIDGQIGMEESLDDYIANLVDIFDGVRRVTRRDGTLWLNIGDSYTSGGRTWRAPDRKNTVRAMDRRPATPDGLKSKDLIGVPWRIAFALQEAGWYLRADVIWSKPNCQPESVKDRPTRAHEYMFLFSKSQDYFYDHKAIMESATSRTGARNRRTVWSINTEPFADAHFATFPAGLIEPPILAGTQ